MRLLAPLAAVGVLTFASASAETTKTLRLATTTSAVNSGLLDYLLPEFTRTSTITVEVSSVGSGQALRMGRRGQADVLLVIAPDAEKEFIRSGFGLKRNPVMRNAFVIVGPVDDPTSVSSAGSIRNAMELIARGPTKFISRGDDSGTHKREISIWRSLDRTPYGGWYHEVGLGMKATLSLASELQAYTLTDTSSWLALRSTLNLKINYQSDEPLLQNSYSIIAVDPGKQAAGTIRADLAIRLIEWMTSETGQSLIADFRVDGTQLFVPSAGQGVE